MISSQTVTKEDLVGKLLRMQIMRIMRTQQGRPKVSAWQMLSSLHLQTHMVLCLMVIPQVMVADHSVGSPQKIRGRRSAQTTLLLNGVDSSHLYRLPMDM